MNFSMALQWLTVSLILAGFSSPSFATADGPDFWQVRDVDKNDVLNIRSKPNFKAVKTGEIPADSQCVKNMGCKGGLTFDEFTTLSEVEKQQILKQRPRWCRVSYQETMGWVSGRYLEEGACPETINYKHHAKQGVDPANHTYLIENEKVTLRNGSARETVSGTTAIIITEVIHKPVYADLDGDKIKEAVSVLMQHTGGTGSFYYLAVASDSSELIESYFLGDRIKIVSLKIVKQLIVVEFLERGIEQSMASIPTVKRSKSLKLDKGKLVVGLQ